MRLVIQPGFLSCQVESCFHLGPSFLCELVVYQVGQKIWLDYGPRTGLMISGLVYHCTTKKWTIRTIMVVK